MIPDIERCEFVSGSAPVYCQVRLEERIGSRERQSTSEGTRWTLRYTLDGTMNECLIDERLRHPVFGLPVSFQGISRSDFSVRNIGWMWWDVEAYYGFVPLARSRNLSTGGLASTPSSFEFSTIGGTTTLTAAIADEYRSEGAPDVGTAIEWDGKRVKGLAVPAGRQRWSETWKFTIDEVFTAPGFIAPLPDSIASTDAWELRDLNLHDRWDAMSGGTVHGVDSFYNPADWTKPTPDNGRTNSAFREFNEGELRFLGAIARRLDDFHMQVTFQFESVRNRWFDVPPSIALSVSPDEYPWRRTNPQDSSRWQIWKYGFDHMQVFYEKQDKQDAGNGDVVLDEAKSVIVQQTIRRIPFHYLGVPTNPIIHSGHSIKPPAVCKPHPEMDVLIEDVCGA